MTKAPAPPTTGPSDDDSGGNGIQAIGHQIGSLASVGVVAAVEFGIPLTPGQQSSILSMIAVLWALFSTIYGIRSNARRSTTRRATARRATAGRRKRPTGDNPAGAGAATPTT